MLLVSRKVVGLLRMVHVDFEWEGGDKVRRYVLLPLKLQLLLSLKRKGFCGELLPTR